MILTLVFSDPDWLLQVLFITIKISINDRLETTRYLLLPLDFDNFGVLTVLDLIVDRKTQLGLSTVASTQGLKKPSSTENILNTVLENQKAASHDSRDGQDN